jgi:hypothetical protein
LSLITAINRASLGFLPVVLALVACTKANPDYCEKEGPCAPGKQCNVATNTCEVPRDAGAEDALAATPDVLAHDSAIPDAHADVVAPDAQDSCTRDDDCSSPDKPMCLRGLCRKCAGAADCGPTAPVCGPVGRCVECTDSTKDCTGPKPICGPTMMCLACADDTACATKSTATPACAAGGACVECTDDKHCTAASKPICDTQMQKCVPCTSDAQCTKKLGLDPGVCMAHQGGRCAIDAETIYVENRNGCAAGGVTGGTSATPFCQPQPAVDLALMGTGNKHLVLIRGIVGGFVAGSAGVSMTVIGQSDATVDPGGTSDKGVWISAGDVYARGLRITGLNSIGVVVESGGVLRMNRCTVESNGKGGIEVNGGGFEITNTVIASNGPGQLGAAAWGGAIITLPPSGKPSKFINNTIVNNKAAGLACSGPLGARGLITHGNTSFDVLDACAITTCCSGDPLLSSTYHLMAGSPCIDKVDPAMSVSDDYDGDARPQGSLSDCGADEYKP